MELYTAARLGLAEWAGKTAIIATESSPIELARQAPTLRSGEGVFFPEVASGIAYYDRAGVQSFSSPTRVRIGTKTLFIARIQGGSNLGKFEELDSSVDLAILWNDLPFGLAQCTQEIEALTLSKNRRVPLLWISTLWQNRSGWSQHRRGFWLSSPNDEILNSAYSTDYSVELGRLEAIQMRGGSPLERSVGELPGLRVLKSAQNSGQAIS